MSAVNKRNVLLVLCLLGAVLLLAGCGVAREGVDIRVTEPDGWWQTLVVWPLARTLIRIADTLKANNIDYPWGYAIIIFTVFIRIILLPLTYVQIRGMQSQKEVQPKLQALQKKYGKDRDRLMREQRKLYEEEGINPLSGCLPILLLVVQMPVLFGLYSALVALGGELELAQFYWIPDLGYPEFTGGLNWITDAFRAGDYATLGAYLVLPVLLVASQFLMTKLTNPMPTDSGGTQASTMRSMSTIMTVMFGFFSLQVPAGLSLYWVIGNLLQMAQQYVMTGRTAAATPGADASTPRQVSSDAGASAETPAADAAVIKPGPARSTSSSRVKRKKRRKKRR